MPNVEECLAHCQFLISKGRGQEAAKLVLPKLEAQRRKANKEGKTRLVKDLHTAQAYAEWHVQFDRFVTICVDPNIGYKVMVMWLEAMPSELIEKWAKEGQ